MATFSGQAMKGWRYFSKDLYCKSDIKIVECYYCNFFKSTGKSSFVSKIQSYKIIHGGWKVLIKSHLHVDLSKE